MKKILLLVPDEAPGFFLTGAEAETGLKVDIDDCVDILRHECSKHTKCKDCRFCNEEMECMLNADIPEMW